MPPCSSSRPSRRRWCWSWTATATTARAAPTSAAATGWSAHWSTGIMNSAGLVYTFVTEYLGFAGFGDEGKVMALAAFGEDTYVERFRDVIRPTPDGGYAVNMAYFSYDAFGQLRPFKRKFIDTFGPPRAPGEPLTDRHRDVAFALQAVTEEIVLHLVRGLLKQAPAAQPLHDRRRGAQLRRQRQDPRADRRASASGCRRAPPTPARRSAARCGTTTRRSGHPRGFELTHAFYGKAYSDDEIERALDDAGPALSAHARGRSCCAGSRRTWPTARSSAGSRAASRWGRARSATARSWPTRAAPTCATSSTPRSRSASLSARSRRPCWSSAPHEFFEIDQPDPFMTLAPRVRADKRAPHPGGRARRRHRPHPDGRALGQSRATTA